MKIEKKIWPEYFEKILRGEKTYDLRLDNFECKSGDILVLKEWDPESQSFTGRTLEKQVTYVGKTKNAQKFWSKEDIEKHGLQIISFR